MIIGVALYLIDIKTRRKVRYSDLLPTKNSTKTKMDKTKMNPINSYMRLVPFLSRNAVVAKIMAKAVSMRTRIQF